MTWEIPLSWYTVIFFCSNVFWMYKNKIKSSRVYVYEYWNSDIHDDVVCGRSAAMWQATNITMLVWTVISSARTFSLGMGVRKAATWSQSVAHLCLPLNVEVFYPSVWQCLPLSKHVRYRTMITCKSKNHYPAVRSEDGSTRILVIDFITPTAMTSIGLLEN